jgi:hypothetical protein
VLGFKGPIGNLCKEVQQSNENMDYGFEDIRLEEFGEEFA